jgi:flavin reductase (DIM6/NTAB) family NADH-FMN oxidoreductase RutF
MKKIKTGAYIPLPVAPIVIVGANVGGKPNYMAAAFVAGANAKPAIIGVSLNKSHLTSRGIVECGSFSVNVPSTAYAVETDYCGIASGHDADKSQVFGAFYGELETAPMIEEFPIVCECRYTGQSVEFAMDTLYFGEVVQVYVNEDCLSADRRIDVLKADPLCFSGLDMRYRALGAELGQAWSIGKSYGKA